MQNEINNRLQDIYNSHWSSFISNGKIITNPSPTNPLLIQLDEETHKNSDIKIMICGQETWGWSVFGDDIHKTSKLYHDFFVLENFYDGYGVSAFWKAYRYFKGRLNEEFPNKKLSFIWQNLSKIGRNDGETGVTQEIRELERTSFPVLSDEIEILKPDILLFLSGPDRDHDISFHFPDATFNAVDGEPNLRALCHVNSKLLPEKTFRTYHPAYYGGFTNELKELIISLIKE